MGLRSTITLSSTKGTGGTIRVLMGVFNDADMMANDNVVDVVLHWDPAEATLDVHGWSPYPDEGNVDIAADRVTWRRHPAAGTRGRRQLFSAYFLRLRDGARVHQDLIDPATGQSCRMPHPDDASSVLLV